MLLMCVRRNTLAAVVSAIHKVLTLQSWLYSAMVLEMLARDVNDIVKRIYYSSNSSLFVIGACECATSLLPINLDQMPGPFIS